MDDDLILADLIEHEIRVARGRHTANQRIICPPANPWMDEQEIDHSLKMDLNPPGALRRMCSDVIQDRLKIGKGRAGVAELHSLCFAHTPRMSESVANSPRAAAAFERSMADRSSEDNSTYGWSSAPASCSTRRAISSCTCGDSVRAASTARSNRSVMYKLYRHLRRSASVARGAHGNRVNAARVAAQPVTVTASWPPAGDDRPTLDETPRHCRPPCHWHGRWPGHDRGSISC